MAAPVTMENITQYNKRKKQTLIFNLTNNTCYHINYSSLLSVPKGWRAYWYTHIAHYHRGSKLNFGTNSIKKYEKPITGNDLFVAWP